MTHEEEVAELREQIKKLRKELISLQGIKVFVDGATYYRDASGFHCIQIKKFNDFDCTIQRYMGIIRAETKENAIKYLSLQLSYLEKIKTYLETDQNAPT